MFKGDPEKGHLFLWKKYFCAFCKFMTCTRDLRCKQFDGKRVYGHDKYPPRNNFQGLPYVRP